jgi:hypothetical protein
LLAFTREDGSVARMAVARERAASAPESITAKLPPVREGARTVPVLDPLAQSGMSATRVDVRPDRSRRVSGMRTPIPMTVPIPMPSMPPLPATSRSPLARATMLVVLASVLAAAAMIAVSAEGRASRAIEERASAAVASPPLLPEAPPPPVVLPDPPPAASTDAITAPRAAVAPPRARHPRRGAPRRGPRGPRGR